MFLVMARLLRLLLLLRCGRVLLLVRLWALLLPVTFIERVGPLVCIRATSSLQECMGRLGPGLICQ